jgi:hypothetical protein
MRILLSCTIILIVFYHSPAAAFFSPAATARQSQSNNITIQNTRKYTPKITHHQLLIKADIAGSSPANKSVENNLIPAADIINLDFPVYNALQNPLAPNDSIEHMLYANLRLKKTLDDYLAVQKAAQALLADQNLSKSFAESTTDIDMQEMTVQDRNLLNFTKVLKAINQEFQGLVQQVSSTISQKSSVRAAAVRPRSYAKDAKGSLGDVPQTSQPAKANITQTANSYMQGILPEQYNSASPTLSTNYTNNNQKYDRSYNAEDITLPWIIRIPLNIFNYLMHNVIEAVIYGMLLLTIVSIISAARSSK